MQSVRVDEITAAWITEHLPAIAEAIATSAASVERAAAASALDAAVGAVRLEGATAERARILGIDGLAAGDRELRDKLVADPLMTVAQAALEIRRSDTTRRRSHLQALVDDERELTPPAPGPTPEPNEKQAAKDAVMQAVKLGVIR